MQWKMTWKGLCGVVALCLISFFVIKAFSGQGNADVNAMFDNDMEDHLFDNHLVLDAKMDLFNYLAEVEKPSDLIVLGTKTLEHEPTVQRDAKGHMIVAYTLSDVKVDRVIQGDVEQGDTLVVYENEAFDSKENFFYHIAGHELMETGSPYLLFLRKSETHDNYIPIGLSYGKVPLNVEKSELQSLIASADSEYSNDLLEEKTHQASIHQKALQKYQKYLPE